MIKVTVGDNLKRSAQTIDESTTLRKALEDGGIDYTTGSVHLDGAALMPGDLDKTFSDFNVKENCYLLKVAKADNAV